jgi:hypothetical protein
VTAAANQFGLSRHIPEAIKREVRVRCGFGCAICGATIIEYEHFYPDFAEALVHSSDQIVLLCPNHHGLVTKGVLPKDQVVAASKAPAAKQTGYSKFSHPWLTGIPSLKIGGGGLVHGTPIPIRIRGENLLQFDKPEAESNIARISASLRDPMGDQFLKIVENEWQVINGNWDFQFIAKRCIFKDRKGVPILVLRMEAPHFIVIEMLRASVKGMQVHITEEKMTIGGVTFSGGIVSGSGVGYMFN